jgi:hypothetical protein
VTNRGQTAHFSLHHFGRGSAPHRQGLASVRQWTSEIVVGSEPEVQDGTGGHCGFVWREDLPASLAGLSRTKKSRWVMRLCPGSWRWMRMKKFPGVAGVDLRFFEGDKERFAGAEFARKVWFLGRWITHGDWYPDRVLRLFSP